MEPKETNKKMLVSYINNLDDYAIAALCKDFGLIESKPIKKAIKCKRPPLKTV